MPFLNKKSTKKQKNTVHFIESWCDITFEGNINDFFEVSDFISDYLDIAKEVALDAITSYTSYIQD